MNSNTDVERILDDMQQRTKGGISIADREISDPKELGEWDPATVEWLDFSEKKITGESLRSPFDVAAEHYRKTLLKQAPAIAQALQKTGLITQQGANYLVAQAGAAQKEAANAKRRKDSPAGQTKPGWTAPHWDDVPQSHQLVLEDLFTSMDFVPIPKNIKLEIYEQDIFEENHISGAIVTRLANAITKRGWDYPRYKETLEGDDEDDAEIDALADWFDNVNTVNDFREIVEHLGAFYQTTGNSYLEVIRDEMGDGAAQAMPAGLDWAISSTMRIVRGHRGYVQWLAGQFRWFNPYLHRVEDREAGVELWAEYWGNRGVDVESEEFLESPWSRTLNSEMPVGVWNPHLTEIMHMRDISLSSKYYGFPKDYRLGRLHALLTYSLDFNISLQRNNRIPPFVILFHGKLDEADKKDIHEYFNSLKGPENWGRVPVIQAPAGGGGGAQGGGQRAGMELVRIAPDEKEGIFLELWARVIEDFALHYGIPIDLLKTNNSNRATVIEAREQWNDETIARIHMVFEERLKKLTRYDLGCENRYLHFVDLDTDDMNAKAEEANLWHNMGALNPDEVREKYLGEGPRPGGEQYFGVAIVAEDEVGEEEAAAQAKQLAEGGTKAELDAANQAANANAAGQANGQDDGTSSTKGPVQQSGAVDIESLWGTLMDKYGFTRSS